MSESRDELLRRIDELEGQVESLTAECSALNKELDSFSYSVSHDLRAPLRSIHGFSKILLNKYQAGLDETGQDYLQRVMRASNHMGELLDGLLLLARVSRSELSLKPTDMRALVLQTMQELLESTEERDLCFEVESLPVASGDHKLLGIAMQHLLGNALKFSSREATPCIRVSASEQDGVATYTVADNGVGFDMNYANKLFGALQRLHSTEEFEGIGIGLATVQRIVHRHGGSIYAEAEPGKGARFHFVLNTVTG
jgi:light-regulated signal transduction histidine kinase (bacteriophytochrome)